MLKVGITGGIGSGKSVVLKIFEALGVPAYRADDRAKYLVEHDENVKSAITLLLGAEAYCADGTYNTRWVASKVFNQSELLENLNQIVHPAVSVDYERWLKIHAASNTSYIVKEAALFFEAGTFKDMDVMILVTAPVDLRVQRVLSRDVHRTSQELERIMRKQWTDEQKKVYCDYEIVNDGKLSVLEQVLKIHQHFMSRFI